MLHRLKKAVNTGRLDSIGASSSKTMTLRSQSSKVSTDKLFVEHDKKQSEFVIKINSDRATILYQLDGNTINLKETEVPNVFQGKGVGKVLAEVSIHRFTFHFFIYL